MGSNHHQWKHSVCIFSLYSLSLGLCLETFSLSSSIFSFSLSVYLLLQPNHHHNLLLYFRCPDIITTHTHTHSHSLVIPGSVVVHRLSNLELNFLIHYHHHLPVTSSRFYSWLQLSSLVFFHSHPKFSR